ncbi:MAG TPA: GtrA family protein [Candidatus Onthousia faecigallinarum]|nr:GtrA family protein [Candidatus Onthousia faecigallinarum]
MKKDNASVFVKKCLKIFHIKVKPKTEKLLIQIFKFGIVGVIATVIDFAFLYLFREFLHFPVLLANTLSFCISVIYNYTASVKWVFDVNKEKDARKQFVIFIIFSVIGLLLNDLIMWVSTDLLSIYYLLAKIIATLIVMVFNFVTRKLFLE